MKRVTPEIAAGTEGLPRQKKWKIIRFRMGCCVNCGDERGDSPFKRVCGACGEARKKKRRRKLGSKPWTPGGQGRPPLSIKKQEEQQ